MVQLEKYSEQCTLGNRLRHLRKAKGLSERDVTCTLLPNLMNRGYLSSLEKGLRPVPIGISLALCVTYEATLEEALKGVSDVIQVATEFRIRANVNAVRAYLETFYIDRSVGIGQR